LKRFIRRQAVVFVVIAALAAVLASVALAWSDSYVNGATYWAGDGNRSGYNSNLLGNALTFNNAWGGSPQMCSMYVDANGLAENSVVCSPSSFIDSRTTTYGAANCHANSGNAYPVYVTQCYTNN